MGENNIRVLIADDSTVGREGLRRIFEATDNITIIGECKNALEILRYIQENSPDVLILDLSFYGDESAGRDAIHEVRAFKPELGIIAVTAYDWLMPDARRAGADVVLSRVFESDQIINLIIELSNRKKNFLVNSSETSEIVNSLTDREIEVLRLIAGGLKDKEIAEKLYIAESTAKNHVSNILTKLDVRNRVEATKKAYELNLIRP